MTKKIYYELKLVQKSPLRIGGVGSERTDSDLMLDGRGMPFIPGSSIAGVLRSMISENAAKKIFGTISDGECKDSRIVVGDGELVDISPVMISKRDGVALNDWCTAQNKYDYEVAETDYPYISIVEWSGDEQQYVSDIESVIDPLFSEIVHSGIRFGAKTTRGFGNMDVSIRKRIFDFPADLETWISLDPYNKAGRNTFFEQADVIKGSFRENSSWINIRADISVDGNFSVSVPTSKVELAENGTSPDKIPLKDYKERPVISGTAWAGTFRHHMNELCQQLGISREQVNGLFGIENEQKHEYSRSKIRFSESVVTGGKEVVVTRNAVDRFTGGPRNSALFTAELCYGGRSTLEITYTSGITPIQKQLLSLTIYDLQLGLVTVGGEGNVGRGRVHIDSLTVNDKDKTTVLNDALQGTGEFTVSDLLEG